MYDWQTKGCSRYGASMGRKSDLPLDFRGTVQIRRVPLDEGGYDRGGAYWGVSDWGFDLYCAFDKDGRTLYRRAKNPEYVAKFLPYAKVEIPAEITDDDIEDMLDGYMRCALWSTDGDDPDYEGDPMNNPGGVPLDARFNESDIHPDTVAKMRRDCAKFAHDNASTLLTAMAERPKCDWSLAGHDLWLNRNGHGCGFKDGDWPKDAGIKLDEAAKDMGEHWIYAGDDGKVHG